MLLSTGVLTAFLHFTIRSFNGQKVSVKPSDRFALRCHAVLATRTRSCWVILDWLDAVAGALSSQTCLWAQVNLLDPDSR
jgi:hypothetical protein